MDNEFKMIEFNEPLEEKYQLSRTLQASIEKRYLKRDGISGLYFLIEEINKIESAIRSPNFQKYVFKETIVSKHDGGRLFPYVKTEQFKNNFRHFKTWWSDYRGSHLNSLEILSPEQFVEEMGNLIPLEIQKAIELLNSISLDEIKPMELLYVIYTYLDLLQWLKRKFNSELHIIVYDSEKREQIRSELRQKIEWNGSGADFSYLICRLFNEAWIQISGYSFQTQADFLLSHFEVPGDNGPLSSETLKNSLKKHNGIEFKRPFKVDSKKKKIAS